MVDEYQLVNSDLPVKRYTLTANNPTLYHSILRKGKTIKLKVNANYSMMGDILSTHVAFELDLVITRNWITKCFIRKGIASH